MRRRADHVTIINGGVFQCNHCGAKVDPFNGQPTVDTLIVTATGKAFTERHADCPEPTTPLCEFCRAPDHDWHGHVNATTKSAADWIGCGDTGASSTAIYRHMIGLPASDDYPLDPDDFGRCYRLLSAPWAATWRPRIGEMAQYGKAWAALAGAWDELEALYRKEAPTATAPRLYKRMSGLREAAEQ